MQIGSLVRETIDDNIGIILAWENDGWLVRFLDYDEIFYMPPKLLELVD
jgi:hypothetical protein